MYKLEPRTFLGRIDEMDGVETFTHLHASNRITDIGVEGIELLSFLGVASHFPFSSNKYAIRYFSDSTAEFDSIDALIESRFKDRLRVQMREYRLSIRGNTYGNILLSNREQLYSSIAFT